MFPKCTSPLKVENQQQLVYFAKFCEYSKGFPPKADKN